MSAAVMILPHCCRAADALVAVLLGVVYLQVCKSKERSSVQRTGHGGASRGERLMHGHFYDAFRVRPCSMQLCMQHATCSMQHATCNMQHATCSMQHATVHLDAPPPSSCFMPPQAIATDLTLEALLGTLKPAGEHFLDLSGSRLTALSLPALTTWLQQHPAARACVHCTNIGFYETCRHLMEQFGNLELIKSHRLAFSVDEAGRKLDSLHAGAFLQGRTVGLAEALAQVQGSLQATAASLQRVQELHEQEERRRIAEQEAQRRAAEQEAQRCTTVQEAAAQRRRDAELTARIDKLNKGCLSLYSHHKSQSDSYEVLVTSLLRVHLKADGCEVFELPRCRHTLPKFLPDYEHGVEWDGVLFVPALKHLYLVEAKSNLENKHITGMPPRIQRTLQFMQLCDSGRLPPRGATYHDKELCSSWARLAAADQVFGVVGAPGFTSDMLKTADVGGLLAVFFNSGAYHLQPPQSGAMRCHKTGQHVAACKGAEMAEEDVEDALTQEALEKDGDWVAQAEGATE